MTACAVTVVLIGTFFGVTNVDTKRDSAGGDLFRSVQMCVNHVVIKSVIRNFVTSLVQVDWFGGRFEKKSQNVYCFTVAKFVDF